MSAATDRGLRLHVDWTKCDGRGLCAELLSAIERDQWGYPIARGQGSDIAVAERERDAASDAVALCPKLALTLLPRR